MVILFYFLYNKVMKIIIWDFNGTILDDVQCCIDIENRIAIDWQLHIPYITKEKYLANFGFPVREYYRKMGYDFNKISYEDVAQSFHHYFNERYKHLKLCLGFLERADDFQKKGYKQIILSATKQEELQKQVSTLKIDDYFEEIIGVQDHLANSKIDSALTWMKKSNIKADECIYIGDTDHDEEVAKAIGVKRIYLVAQGHQSYERLQKTEAKVLESLLQWPIDR